MSGTRKKRKAISDFEIAFFVFVAQTLVCVFSVGHRLRVYATTQVSL